MKAFRRLIHFEKQLERKSKTYQLRIGLIVFGISIVIGGLMAYTVKVNETKNLERTLVEVSEAQKKQMDQRLEMLKQIRYANKAVN